ncbi:hypothetical protein QAD02_019721 [Eretmocerus hayati]|uniref:Uncharacterized protein n=1 Tax=Eretmocerus hayati TaxID=131215 RepID=A0ACC2PMX0_9HYME|nr:hypothetical protein QAD02_019721 [Eretmocerus hayati]
MMRVTRQFIRRMSKIPDAHKTDPEDLPRLRENKLIGPSLQHWVYQKMGFNKYGLMRDDILEETAIVRQALTRIPPHVVDERNFRIVRAAYLTLKKEILPKEEWTKLEDDKLYLTPVIEQIEKENAEKEEWEKN